MEQFRESKTCRINQLERDLANAVRERDEARKAASMAFTRYDSLPHKCPHCGSTDVTYKGYEPYPYFNPAAEAKEVKP